ncbi:MAG: helix-turn-helix transcriptional regulator [Pseudooceanicola sp.]
MLKRAGIILLFAVQLGCALFFVSGILSSIIGFRATPLSWRAREMIEIGAAFGLVLGVVLGAVILRQTLREKHRAENRLRLASGAFMDMVLSAFDEWELTPAERDVALFSVKGMSLAEIADMRSVSEGTVKAQTNAIYRKAGVSGRAQLLSHFIDELVELPTGVAALAGSDEDGEVQAQSSQTLPPAA